MREQRLVFGEDAELYDRARPAHPGALVRDLLRLPGGPPRWVVDAGCGTGKAAAMLADAGVHGVGIEAHPAMAAVAWRLLAQRGWRVDVGRFETWEPAAEDPPVDLVVSAQAWHWFDPGSRFHQASRILRPGGWLALWWYHPAPVPGPVRRAIDAVYSSMAPGLPDHSFGRASGRVLRHDPGEVPERSGFGDPLRRAYRWSRAYTAAEWTDYLRTQSDHRMLDGVRLEELLAEVSRVIRNHGDRYVHRYRFDLWAVQRRDG